jgi:hypothetical protein
VRHFAVYAAALVAVVCFARAQVAAAQSTTSLSSGWTLLKDGDAEGTVEQDAKHPTRDSSHLLKISVTSTAAPKKGRVGATNNTTFAVHEGRPCDVTFSALTERRSIGLVFSLEGADGKVYARTTLPEIGRGRPGGDSETGGAWRDYVVRLSVRASDPKAHLTIVPIEPITVWLDDVKITERPAEQ